MKIILRPEAERDLTNTYLWYEEQSPGLGVDFIRSVDACLSSLERFPLASPRIHKRVRRMFLRRFPYGVFYAIHKQHIIVLAVFHFRRDTEYLIHLRSRLL